MMLRADYDELDSPDGDTYYWMDTPDGVTYRFTNEKLFTGVAYQLRRDGQLASEEGFLNGQRHGPVRVWYPSGQLQEERTSYNGLVYGPEREWDEAGQLRREAFIEYGVRVREKKWDADGRLIEEYEMAPDDPRYSRLEGSRARYGNDPRLGQLSVEAASGVAEKAGAAEKAGTAEKAADKE